MWSRVSCRAVLFTSSTRDIAFMLVGYWHSSYFPKILNFTNNDSATIIPLCFTGSSNYSTQYSTVRHRRIFRLQRSRYSTRWQVSTPRSITLFHFSCCLGTKDIDESGSKLTSKPLSATLSKTVAPTPQPSRQSWTPCRVTSKLP